MNKLKGILWGGFVFGLAACTSIDPILPDQMTQNLSSILKVEERADQVRSSAQALQFVGGMTEDQAKRLKSHFDIYFVHYLAANVYLAEGNIGFYETHVNLAEKELVAMDTILNEPVKIIPGTIGTFSSPTL